MRRSLGAQFGKWVMDFTFGNDVQVTTKRPFALYLSLDHLQDPQW